MPPPPAEQPQRWAVAGAGRRPSQPRELAARQSQLGTFGLAGARALPKRIFSGGAAGPIRPKLRTPPEGGRGSPLNFLQIFPPPRRGLFECRKLRRGKRDQAFLGSPCFFSSRALLAFHKRTGRAGSSSGAGGGRGTLCFSAIPPCFWIPCPRGGNRSGRGSWRGGWISGAGTEGGQLIPHFSGHSPNGPRKGTVPELEGSPVQPSHLPLVGVRDFLRAKFRLLETSPPPNIRTGAVGQQDR